MIRFGTIAAAFVFGVAIGFLNNTISNLAWRLGGKGTDQAPGKGAGGSSDWPSLLAVQYVLRILLSLVSLYVTYRYSRGDPVVVVANLGGLLLTRYWLLWRLTQQARGGKTR